MQDSLVSFGAIFFCGLALIPSAAHVMELPNKIHLLKDEYFVARGWQQVIFWTLTFPANRATRNWTQAPPHWEQLRRRWEYSHATSAVLDLVAFVAAVLAVLWS